MDWKVRELVRIRGGGIGKDFYNEKDQAIANILQVSTRREYQPENTVRSCLVTNKEDNAIVHKVRRRDDTIQGPAGLCSENTATNTKLSECHIRFIFKTGNTRTAGFHSLHEKVTFT